jgi:hypothetical protein
MNEGPKITPYGDVISSNLSSSRRYGDASLARYSAFNLMPGQIVQIYAVDDANNLPGGSGGVQTLYDVIVYHPDGTTELVRRCTMLEPGFGGGFNNFMEVLPVNPGPQAQNGKISSSSKPGSHVLIAFLNGHKQSGVILGALPHPGPVAVKKRPKKSQGTTVTGEFQGFQWEIRNDGSFKITFNGPRNDQGEIIGKDGPTSLEIDAKGNVALTTNNNQSVNVDRVNGVVDVVNGTTEIKMEQNGSKITTTSDFLTANVRQDARVDVGHQAKVIAKNDITVSSDTMIKLQRGEGAKPAEPFVLGENFVQFMSQVLQAIILHTHIDATGFQTLPPFNEQEFKRLKQSPIDDRKIQSKLIIGDN